MNFESVQSKVKSAYEVLSRIWLMTN